MYVEDAQSASFKPKKKNNTVTFIRCHNSSNLAWRFLRGKRFMRSLAVSKETLLGLLNICCLTLTESKVARWYSLTHCSLRMASQHSLPRWTPISVYIVLRISKSWVLTRCWVIFKISTRSNWKTWMEFSRKNTAFKWTWQETRRLNFNSVAKMLTARRHWRLSKQLWLAKIFKNWKWREMHRWSPITRANHRTNK